VRNSGDRSPDGPVRVDDVAGAATRSGGLEYRATTAQWHADMRAKRPKMPKLAANDALRSYVQDRLAGTIVRRDGVAAPGRDVR